MMATNGAPIAVEFCYICYAREFMLYNSVCHPFFFNCYRKTVFVIVALFLVTSFIFFNKRYSAK